MKPKIIRTSTVAVSLDILLKGQLAFLNDHYEVVAVSGADGHLETVAAREGVRMGSVVMSRSISPIKDVVSLIKLYFLFKKEKPMIVHSITPKAGLLSMLAGKMAGVPNRLHTFTGLIFPTRSGVMQKLLIFMDRLLCNCATNIYPEGEGVKQDLINYGITSKPLKVLANGNVNGIDGAYFNPNIFTFEAKQLLRNQLKLSQQDLVFIFVGRMVGDKGINELVAAFDRISKQHQHLKLLLVGAVEAELDPLASDTLVRIENNPNIISVGFQSDVRPYFAIADILVFPSYREGFPNVVMQAGSMGLPCIVSDINGCNEIIVEGQNGLIIPVKNTDAVQEAMLKLIEDESLRFALKSNSRPMITARYEQQLVWDAILKEYKTLTQDV